MVDYPFIEYDETIFIPSDLRSEEELFNFRHLCEYGTWGFSSLSFTLGLNTALTSAPFSSNKSFFGNDWTLSRGQVQIIVNCKRIGFFVLDFFFLLFCFVVCLFLFCLRLDLTYPRLLINLVYSQAWLWVSDSLMTTFQVLGFYEHITSSWFCSSEI